MSDCTRKGIMKFPSDIITEIQARMDRAKKLNREVLSKDGKALLVEGSIGYSCYVSPDGDVFMETYDVADDKPPTIDRSRPAQIAVLLLGSRTIPALSTLLPTRPADAPTCDKCHGTGWLNQELFSGQFEGMGVLCDRCSGLGWLDADPSASTE